MLFWSYSGLILISCLPSPRFRTPMISRVVSVTAWAVSALLMLPVFLYASTIDRG